MTTATTQLLVDFRVDGIPKPQGSKRAFVNPKTRRAVVVDDNKAALRDWRGDVKWMALKVMNDKRMILQPAGVYLEIEFVMPRPLSTPKSKTPLAVKKPDIDKLIRAVMDALTGVVYNDDAQVVHLVVGKRLAEIGEGPGALITVTEWKTA
jgi:Holliday junction resolvase RusA-like endonuclease